MGGGGGKTSEQTKTLMIVDYSAKYEVRSAFLRIWSQEKIGFIVESKFEPYYYGENTLFPIYLPAPAGTSVVPTTLESGVSQTLMK